MSTKKTDSLIKKILENVSRISDEEVLTSILVFSSMAAKDPVGTKAKATAMAPPKPKVLIPAPEKTATEARILEYTFGDKKMVALQTNGKPADDVLAVCKGARMRFYSHVPSNPFNNGLPFWAGKATEELKSALLAVT
jgi:hypothetical protein